MAYKLAIFDFDGTLADTFPLIINIFSHLAKEHHYDKITDSQLEEFKSQGVRKLIQKYKFPIWKIPMIAKDVQTMMSEDIHQISLFKDIENVLKELSKNGIQLALVSSNEINNIKKVLGDEVASLFSFFECGVSMFSKQSKFKKIVKASGVQENQTLCIGDEIRDIQAAHRANIPFGAVAWGYTNIETLLTYHPQEVFHSVFDINCAFISREPNA
jgi:phosphoglycolate phosphatase